MKKALLLYMFGLILHTAQAQPQTQTQTLIKGSITDTRGEALAGVNVYIKNTYDGTSTDAGGTFSFRTSEKGSHLLTATFVGYKLVEKPVELNGASIELRLQLQEERNELNTVVITAGAFEASDERKTTILRPIDIFTTAGANADIAATVQTLPGAQRVGNEEGLFVRGGSAQETKTIIDGTLVENPFYSATPDVAQRSRFSPALFKGTSFSTGGYSAQYGQALSSLLVLNTKDLPDSSKIDIGLMAAGGYITKTQRWKNTSLVAEGMYTHLGLLFKAMPQNMEWPKIPRSASGSLIFKHKPSNNAMLKVHSNYSWSSSALRYRDFENIDGLNTFGMDNNHLYINSSYQQALGEGKWIATGGASYSYNHDAISLNQDQITRYQQRTQARGTISRSIGEGSSVLAGAEIHQYSFGDSFNGFSNRLSDTYAAAFAESDIYLTRKLAARIGLRAEYSSLLKKANIAPRSSLAYKTGNYSQVSLAYGQFYQSPENRYLVTNQNLDFEKASHVILNYQIIKNKRTFRAEAYYKDYSQLVKEQGQLPFDPTYHRQPSGLTDNSGKGYAQGLDLFWRDQKSLQDIDYWVSYSFLDTKRHYQNFLSAAMPTFTSKHNLSVVSKKYVSAISSLVGVSYNFASGRPYYNPHADSFLSDRTKPYHSLNINISYLTQIRGNFTVVFFSVNNVAGTKNVFGYRYSADGTRRISIGQPTDRTIFLGMFISIGAGFDN
ncbi:TonB-dependent receptor [Rhodocytophaga aerolata]|uniref:TonB-dependent receptor n=1 Tax=Rhodocytophaga aerolata TaxID=455078 RepID=A0ABT8RCE2_9BACT|nr:TonB-dependent receptor [Rhodocytophaga aerolata]MDO1449765.1 TonB-dependent receptor [Rhodocytophaga aerolata]